MQDMNPESAAPESAGPEHDTTGSQNAAHNMNPGGAEDGEALDPVLQQQLDDNLQLLYRSKLESTLPDTLQALVRKLLDEGKSH